MNPVPNTSDGWQECQPGEVRQLVQRLRRRQRLQTFGQAAAVTGVLLVGVFTAFQWFGADPAGVTVRPISCDKVHELAPPFVAGTLDTDRNDQIVNHLGRCRGCRRYFAREFPSYALPPVSRDFGDQRRSTVVGSLFASR